MQLLVMGIGLFKSLLVVVHTPPENWRPLPKISAGKKCKNKIKNKNKNKNKTKQTKHPDGAL
jgi:hypothetical protein